jgi:hypothetical protein
MKKLKLDAESLEVESFATKEQPSFHGTVHGRSDAGSGCWPYECYDTANIACVTIHTACDGCGTGAADDSCACQSTKPNQTECHDCEI